MPGPISDTYQGPKNGQIPDWCSTDDYVECERCGWPHQEVDSWESACVDDMCHGGGVPCMHGSYSKLRCDSCGN